MSAEQFTAASSDKMSVKVLQGRGGALCHYHGEVAAHDVLNEIW